MLLCHHVNSKIYLHLHVFKVVHESFLYTVKIQTILCMNLKKTFIIKKYNINYFLYVTVPVSDILGLVESKLEI